MSTKKYVNTLKKMCQVIELGWCRGENARDKNNQPCLPRSKNACRWCIEGAYRKVSGFNLDFWNWLGRELNQTKSPKDIYRNNFDIINFNDVAKSKKEVLSKLKKIIKKYNV